MADGQAQHAGQDARGCGMFDFLKKKNDEDVAMADAEKKDGLKEEKHSLRKTFKRSDSSSSSSSEEEEGEDGDKKKKKGLKEKIQEKLSGEKEENAENKETAMFDKHDEVPTSAETTHPEEKKGFLEKIKEKLPGQHKSAAEGNPNEHSPQGDDKEKKGLLEKIKEKLPSHHGVEEKAKHKET